MPAVRRLLTPTSSLAALYPGQACRMRVTLAPGAYPRGTLLAERETAPGVFLEYAPGHTNGTEVPKVILEHDTHVGDDGVAWEGSLVEGEGTPSGKASAYFAGDFNTQELVGLDDSAVHVLGHMIEGDIYLGVLHVG